MTRRTFDARAAVAAALVVASPSSLVPFAPSAARADSYRYVRIFDTRQGPFFLDGLRRPVIDNSGSVAFYRQQSIGVVSGFYRGFDGLSTPIVTDAAGGPLEGQTLYQPSINASGRLAFAGMNSSTFSIYRANLDGSVNTIGVGTASGLNLRRSITNSGTVAYTTGNGLVVGDGTTLTPIYTEGDGSGVAGGFSNPSFSDSGMISFASVYSLATSGVAHLKGTGGTPVIIADGLNNISSFSDNVINNSGEVLFGATTFDVGQVIYRGSGGALSTIADTSGPYSDLAFIEGVGAGGFPTMNNAGTVAFQATLDAGGNGIFTGADPATNAVIQSGTTLFGRTLHSFPGGLSRDAINDAGEITFMASLLDPGGFSDVVVKAIPTPDQEWDNTGGGDWSDSGNWLGPVPNAVHHTAAFGDRITAPATVVVDAPFTAGTIIFDNSNKYTINGPGAITLDDSFVANVKSNSGTHEVNAPLVLRRNTQARVDGPELTLSNVSVDRSRTPQVDLSKSGAGALRINKLDFDKVRIDEGKIRILAGGGTAATSRMRQLIIAGAGGAWTAQLDLNDSRAIVDYEMFFSPADEVFDQVKQGYAGGAWTGMGIASAAAAADPIARTGIGFAEASDLFGPGGGTFGGQAVDGTALLMTYTLYGDANLDRSVNITDFARLGANFNLPGSWSMGDFNYDGAVGISDFARLAANFNQSLAIDLPRASSGSAVPEPALMAWPLALLCRRRRVAA